MSVHIKPNGTYYVRYRLCGAQVHKSFGKGEEGKKLAHAFDADRKMIAKQKKQNTLSQQPTTIMYLDELATEFFETRYENKNKKWVIDWKKMLNRHILPALGQIPIANFTEGMLKKCIAQKFPNAQAVSHGRYLSYLKIMLNFGVKYGYIKENPLRFWSKPKTQKRPFSMTLDTIKAILDVAPPHLAFAIRLACNTGVRTGQSELLALKWEHVLWEESAIQVFATKTNTWRTIPINSSFMQDLRQHYEQAQSDYIVEYKGKKVNSIRKAFHTACKKANVSKGARMYDLRHWYCTTLMSLNTPVHVASELMGHSSADMTLNTYSHVLVSDKQYAVAKLPVI